MRAIFLVLTANRNVLSNTVHYHLPFQPMTVSEFTSDRIRWVANGKRGPMVASKFETELVLNFEGYIALLHSNDKVKPRIRMGGKANDGRPEQEIAQAICGL